MVTLAFVGGIIVFFLLDLLVMRVLEKQRAKKRRIVTPEEDVVVDFHVPKGWLYHPGHVWAKMLDQGNVAIGVDDFANRVIADVEKIEVPGIGDTLEVGKKAFAIIQGEKKLVFASPLSGKVAKINQDLAFTPDVIQKDAYRAGWVLEIAPDADKFEDFSTLTLAENAAKWMESEVDRLDSFIDKHHPEGIPEGLLDNTSDAVWNAFQLDFLSQSAKQEN